MNPAEDDCLNGFKPVYQSLWGEADYISLTINTGIFAFLWSKDVLCFLFCGFVVVYLMLKLLFTLKQKHFLLMLILEFPLIPFVFNATTFCYSSAEVQRGY